MSHPWRTACPDWQDRLLSGLSLVPELPLFREEADKALRIFRRLRIPDMPGKPTMDVAAGPWLFPIVEAIFGSLNPETNIRMIQEFFWMIPKKNTKSSSSAAIMVEALILNRRPEGEFVLVAPTKEIADISFRQASGTIAADAELDKVFQRQSHVRKITHRLTGATLQVKAADTDVITGGKQVGTLVDELHVLAKKSNAAEIVLELRGALTARQDGFLIFITTQSKEPPFGIFKSELEKARDVRDGKVDLPLLPILYELPRLLAADGGWKERKYWAAVNPNLNRSVSEDYLERQLGVAEREGAHELALFASQHFNVEIGQGLRTDRWAGADFWERNGTERLSFDELLKRSEVIVFGIDGGGLDDLLGAAAIGRCKETKKWLLWNHAWAHEIVLERRKSEASKLRDFAAAGELTIVAMPGEDVAQVGEYVARAQAAGLLAEKRAVGVDAVGIGDIVDELTQGQCALDEDRIVGVPQGWKLLGAIKTTERKLAGGDLLHSGSALMAWCVANAKIELRGNAALITKQVSGSAKIDPLIATFNAVALMSLNPAPQGEPSVLVW